MKVLPSLGFPLVSETEWQSTPTVARVSVSMPVVCGDDGWCGYSVILSLDQHVQVMGGGRALATTWRNSYTRAVRQT